MKKALLALGVAALLAAPAHADITHKISSSVSLSVDGAGSVATRIPSSMAVSGSNVTLGTVPVLGSLSAGTALGYTPGAYSITTAGDAFSYSESYTGGDNTPSVLSTTVTGGVVPACQFTVQRPLLLEGLQALAGTIATDGAIALTSGGAGTQAVGQVILELTVK